MKEQNKNTKNMRTRLDDTMLKKAGHIAEDIAEVCRKLREDSCTFTQACRAFDLEPKYTRKLILNYLGKCKQEQIDLAELEFGFIDSYEEFYKNIFGDRIITIAQMPADYKESTLYVLDETGLDEMEALVLKLKFQLIQDSQKLPPGLDEETIKKVQGFISQSMYEVSDSVLTSRNVIADILGVSPPDISYRIARGLYHCRKRPRVDMLAKGLAAYRQAEEQKEELARRKLRYKKEEHEACMARLKQEHKQNMTDIEKDRLPKDILDRLENTGIDVLGLSIRPYNALYRSGIKDLLALVKKDQNSLLMIHALGSKSQKEILKSLDEYFANEYGIHLKEFKEQYFK